MTIEQRVLSKWLVLITPDPHLLDLLSRGGEGRGDWGGEIRITILPTVQVSSHHFHCYSELLIQFMSKISEKMIFKVIILCHKLLFPDVISENLY